MVSASRLEYTDFRVIEGGIRYLLTTRWTPSRSPVYLGALPQPFPSISKMSVFNNNSADTNFGFDFYLFGDGQPPTFVNPYIFDSVATANGQDGSHADNLDPPTEGYVDQFGYQDCTILNMSGSQVVNPYTSHTESPHENSGTGEPMLATALDNDLNKDELSTIRSPVHSDVPIPIPSYTTKILSYGPSEQPLVGQFSDSRRSDAYLTTSAEKGKIQTMDCVPPLHSVVLLLNHQQPPTADTRGGSSLQTVSHLIQLVRVISSTTTLPGSQCTTQHRPSYFNRSLFWTPTTQKRKGDEGKSDTVE